MSIRLIGRCWLLALGTFGVGGMWAIAAPVTWVGGNGVWTDGSANDANWNPADEPDIDDEAIFNSNNSVSLGSANTVQSLTMSGGIDLSASGFGLTVDGLAQLVDAGTNLNIEGAGSALIADSVTINSGGAIRLNGLVSVSEESGDGLVDINAGGTISGSGTVHLGDFVAAGATLLVNDGTISAFAPAPFPGAVPPVRTLAINAADASDALIDLDGGAANAVLEVTRNQTLDINVRLTDQFSDDINLFHNSTLDFSNAWILDSGTIDVETGFVNGGLPNPDIPASTARISGAAFTQTGGTITVTDLDGTLQFNAPFTMSGGTLVNNGLVVFSADATIAAGANLTMPTGSSSITVNSAVTVNIDQANFDADGAGSATNVLTVHSGGVLDLDLGAGADESLGGFIRLNGGELEVTTAGSDWSITGNVNVGEDTGTSQINGEEVAFTTAAVVIGESATLEVNAASVWEAQSSLAIDAGATARLNGTTTFNGGTITGNGTLRTAGITTFDGPTTITLPSGAVILDGDDGVGGNVTINADTTINAGTMADFGNDNVIGFNTLVLNDVANLTVNLLGFNPEWTLTADGRLDINASTTVDEGSGIHGSDFNMAGNATISGNSLWEARTDISGTVTIAAGGRLILSGGGHTNVNRLEGGTINGPGSLGAGTINELHGFGTIDADIDFDGDSELFAADGTLTLSGDILDARFLGTAGANAILDVINPWSTGVIQQVVLNGGELRGAAITNDELIRGASGETLVTARVINNLQIFADGGDIIFDTAGNDNDWDGAANSGQLNAFNGEIILHDNQDFSYGGTVFIGDGSEVSMVGFGLEFEPGSLIDLSGGTLRLSGNRTSEIGGEVVVDAGPDSQLRTNGTPATFEFESTSEVTLNGNLRLDSGITLVEPGATFSGAGRLINDGGRLLMPDDMADIGVIVENRGIYANNNSSVGRNDMFQFVQTASGIFRVNVEGPTSVTPFDHLYVDGPAQLAGVLEPILGSGYLPVAGDMFDIITATGEVSGTFDNVLQPPGMPEGLMFDVAYNPTFVRLMVVPGVSLPGDYNFDGTVDGADYVVWRKTDGMPEGYNLWRANFGRTAAPASASSIANVAVPEANCLLLLSIALLNGQPTRSRSFAPKSKCRQAQKI